MAKSYWTQNKTRTGNVKGLCQICGFVCYQSQLRRMWNGIMACPDDWNSKPINDFPPIPPKDEGRAVPFPSPDDNSGSAYPNYTVSTPPYSDGSNGGTQ